jgi:exodeoxyribonuclease VII large subunit
MIEQRRVYTVSEINDQIKVLLEKAFPLIWIIGEVSNFRKPVSGHYYFTLKDAHSQIAAVMFRPQIRNLQFDLEDGQRIVGLGRISVYEPRGAYQVILEYLEPKGIGALQIAFEQLKARLASEGLFDEDRKKIIPFFPSVVSVITSPDGAVIHDIIRIAARRFPGIPIEIVPVKVQGDTAIHDIENALMLLNARMSSDVIILARGGGSLEDMQAFNSEQVARAISASQIPVVSAVGHETDFTIADFAADLRAPTPSAAAELVFPSRYELSRQCAELTQKLFAGMRQMTAHLKTRLMENVRALVHPRQRIQDGRIRLDDLAGRLSSAAALRVQRQREYLEGQRSALLSASPAVQIRKYHGILEQNRLNLLNYIKIAQSEISAAFREVQARLQTLNPRAILSRGYSITRKVADATVVRSSRNVVAGEELEILLADGTLICRVEKSDRIAKQAFKQP